MKLSECNLVLARLQHLQVSLQDELERHIAELKKKKEEQGEGDGDGEGGEGGEGGSQGEGGPGQFDDHSGWGDVDETTAEMAKERLKDAMKAVSDIQAAATGVIAALPSRRRQRRMAGIAGRLS